MANEIDIDIGTFNLDTTNDIAIKDINIKVARAVSQADLAKFHGSVIPIGKRKSITVQIKGTIIGSDYDDLRSNLDALKAAMESVSEQKLTLDDDRFLMVQYSGFSYSYATLRTFADFSFDLIASDPLWLSETLSEDKRIPTSGVGYTIANAGNAPTRAKITITAPPPNLLTKGNMETWTGLTNILADGGLEAWDDANTLTNWTFGDITNSTLNRSTTVKAGSYSAKLEFSGGGSGSIYQAISSPTSYRSKILVLSGWVKSNAAGTTSLQITYDGTGGTSVLSSYHTGGNGWEYLIITAVIPADATAITIKAYSGGTVATAVYFDSLICYEMLAPTDWTLVGSGATVAREEGTINAGTYSGKLTRASASPTNIYQDVIAAIGNPEGKSYTFKARVYATAPNTARIGIATDATGSANSAFHSGTPGWEWLTVSATIGGGASYLSAVCSIAQNSSSAYFDDLIVVEGDGSNIVGFHDGNGDIADDIQLENETTGELFKYRGTLLSGDDLVVNNRVDDPDLAVENDGDDDIANFEGDFVTLNPGNNTIKFTGAANAQVALEYRKAWY